MRRHSSSILNMKLLIIFSAVILVVSTMPTDVGKDFGFGQEIEYIPMDTGAADAATFNGTARNIPYGQMGFATVGGGTVGGAGGTVWTVWDAWALRDAVTGDERRIIYIRGRIDLIVLFTGSPGVFLRIGSWKSIIGGDSNAMIVGGGLIVRSVQQVIFQDLKLHNALSFAPGEQPNGNGGIISMVPGEWSTLDNIELRTAEYVWIDHCEFADDPWIAHNTPDDQRRHDGLLDIVRASNWISVSNSIFRNHNLVSLVGNGDDNAAQDIGKLKVTFYNNWFQDTTQRNPRVRYGEVHILNNLYTDLTGSRSYGIGVGAGALIYSENNVFVNTLRSWCFPAGTPNPMGYLISVNNLLRDSAHDSGIPSNGVIWRPNHYYAYYLMNVNSVEEHVRRYAGPR